MFMLMSNSHLLLQKRCQPEALTAITLVGGLAANLTSLTSLSTLLCHIGHRSRLKTCRYVCQLCICCILYPFSVCNETETFEC